MELSKASLKKRIITELQAKGFVTEGEFAQVGHMAEAIANAVVDEVNQNAKADVKGGSSK